MKCFNCAEYGHKSSECTNERVTPENGSDHRTCNKCNQKGHISRDCREDAAYGDYQQSADNGYSANNYDGQEGLYDPTAVEEPVVPEMTEYRYTGLRTRKDRKVVQVMSTSPTTCMILEPTNRSTKTRVNASRTVKGVEVEEVEADAAVVVAGVDMKEEDR
jgi:hypothetical protein